PARRAHRPHRIPARPPCRHSRSLPRPRRVIIGHMEIRGSTPADVPAIFAIVNDAAQAYRGVIPADRWHDPYMPMAELQGEIGAGVQVWVAEDAGKVLGVMGIQDKGDVALVRHAYTATTAQRKGVGTRLL